MQEPKISTKPIAENRSSYKSWGACEGIPIIQDFSSKIFGRLHLNLSVRLRKPREIPAGKALKPQRHLFEELIYIVSGRGATTVWNDPASKHTFEWQEGSVFPRH